MTSILHNHDTMSINFDGGYLYAKLPNLMTANISMQLYGILASTLNTRNHTVMYAPSRLSCNCLITNNIIATFRQGLRGRGRLRVKFTAPLLS